MRFRNKWRRIVFYVWIVCIPLALLGGALRAYHSLNLLSTTMLTLGLLGAFVGLIILKTVGRVRK